MTPDPTLAANLRTLAEIQQRAAEVADKARAEAAYPEAYRLYELALKRASDPHDRDHLMMDALCEVLGTWADAGPDAALAWMRGVVEPSGNPG